MEEPWCPLIQWLPPLFGRKTKPKEPHRNAQTNTRKPPTPTQSRPLISWLQPKPLAEKPNPQKIPGHHLTPTQSYPNFWQNSPKQQAKGTPQKRPNQYQEATSLPFFLAKQYNSPTAAATGAAARLAARSGWSPLRRRPAPGGPQSSLRGRAPALQWDMASEKGRRLPVHPVSRGT